MTDNTKYEVTQADIDAAAVRWCGDKERETFPEDIEYFKHNWSALPGLRKYVEKVARHRLTSQPAQSDADKSTYERLGQMLRRENLKPTARFLGAAYLGYNLCRMERDGQIATPTAPQPDRESVLREAREHFLQIYALTGNLAWKADIREIVEKIEALLTYPTTAVRAERERCLAAIDRIKGCEVQVEGRQRFSLWELNRQHRTTCEVIREEITGEAVWEPIRNTGVNARSIVGEGE